MYNVIFNKVSCLDLGVLVKRRPDTPAPLLIQEEYTVPGRDGVLLSTIKRYEPIEIPVEFNFMSKNPASWGHDFRKLKQWLRGSGDLMLSDDDEVFYKVYRAEIASSERTSLLIGSVDVNFVCDPFTYFTSGEEYKTADECIFNNHDRSLPLYHITGSGEYTLTINGKTFSGTAAGNIYLDVEKQQATDGSVLVNTSQIGDYEDLALIEGENNISITNGFDLEIKPRWRSI